MEIEKLLTLYMNIMALEKAMAQGFTIVADTTNGLRLVKGGSEQSVGMVGFADPTFLKDLTDAMGRWQAHRI